MNSAILSTPTDSSTTISVADWTIEASGAFDPARSMGGPIAAAFRIVGPDGVDYHRAKGFPAQAGNSANVAPWWALAAALDWLAREKRGGTQIPSLEIRADLRLLVDQLGSTCKCKSPHLREQLGICHRLLVDLGLTPREQSAAPPWWRVIWVHRERNGAAAAASDAFERVAGYRATSSWGARR